MADQQERESCVIYSRVSTPEQDYTPQTTDLKNYAKYKNYSVKKVFEEKVSGYDTEVEREQFNAMKKYVVKNNIKHILCWEISRFSRKTRVALEEIEFFTEHNVDVYFDKEEIHSMSDNDFNKVLLTLLSSIAEMDRETRKAYQKRGMMKGARSGKAHGFGVMPYGFERNPDTSVLQVRRDESKWVERMYQWRAEGKSVKAICDLLNRKQIETRRRKNGERRKLQTGEEVEILWRQNTITKILRSTLYKGERFYDGEAVPCPRIVSDELWDTVQDTFNKKLGYRIRTEYKYLFKGKVYCGSCKSAYLSRTDLKQDGFSTHYFCWARKDNAIKCKNGQYKGEALDKQVWMMLASMHEFREELFKDRIKIDPQEAKNEISYLTDQIKKAEGKKKRTVKAYIDGNLDEKSYNSELGKAEADVKDWGNIISEIKYKLEKQNSAVSSLNNMKTQNIRWMRFPKRRDYVEKWVDKLVLTKWDGEYIEGTHGNDQVMRVDLYAFGLDKPVSKIISSVSEIMVDVPDGNWIHLHECKKCGKKFTSTQKENNYCSLDCRKKEYYYNLR